MYRNLGKYGKNPGWFITAAFCVLWGISFAVIPDIVSERSVFLVGSASCAFLFIVFMVIPFVLWLNRREPT